MGPTLLSLSNCNPLHVTFYLHVAMLCVYTISSCHIESKESYLIMEGYNTELLSYNVCVDNTTIHATRPTRVPPRRQIFLRRCCGCRVSGASTRTIELETVSWPRETHLFYYTDIRQCQCIQCNITMYAHHRYLRELII